MSTTTRSPRRSMRKTPPAKATAPLPTPQDWLAWQQHLATRDTPATAESVLDVAPLAPLLWGLGDSPVRKLVETVRDHLATSAVASPLIAQLTLWRALHHEQPTGLELGVGAVAWAQALPALAGVISAESWQGLLADLLKLASEAVALNPTEAPLVHQLLAVELPLTLAHVLPELADCQEVAKPARKLLVWGAEELTDGEGLPAAEHITQLKPLLACWARIIALTRAGSEQAIDEDAQVQFEWLLRQTLRVMRDDGSLCFAPLGKQTDMLELATACLQLVDDPDDHALMKAAFQGVKPLKQPAKKKKSGKKELPEPFVYSEWSEFGLLRGDWSLGAPRLAVSFDRRQVHCELSNNSHVLFSGLWTPEISIDGWTWTPENDWEEVCWHTDEDVVYLEIETKLNSGWRVQRQMMLARKDRFVLLADAVLGEEAANLKYRSVLPLIPGVRFSPADETREGHLVAKKSQALVLPLALPEWRSVGGGELQATEQGLEITQVHQGRRLFAPLFIDLDPQRLRKECTWRQLTVAERLEIQPRDTAVAFRAQVGKEQWSLYRSLGEKGNRTYLGHNVVSECQVARFNAKGDAEVILEVE